MNRKKKILNDCRIRSINGSFAFIPHRFLTDGFWEFLRRDELSLYLFLVLVSDKQGLSFYGDLSLSYYLRLDHHQLQAAREGLIDKDLLCFESPCYQLLELPAKPEKRRGSVSTGLSRIRRSLEAENDF